MGHAVTRKEHLRPHRGVPKGRLRGKALVLVGLLKEVRLYWTGGTLSILPRGFWKKE